MMTDNFALVGTTERWASEMRELPYRPKMLPDDVGS